MNDGKLFAGGRTGNGRTLTNRIIVHFFIVCNTVLLVFLCNMVLNLRHELTRLRAELPTRQDMASLRVGEVELMHEERCTRCHTEQKFTVAHSEGELEASLRKMGQLPAAHLTDADLSRVHASITVERCLECHSRDVLKELALTTRAQRMDTIRSMERRAGKSLKPGEIEKINQSLEIVLGF